LQNALPLSETERLFRWLESLDVISTQADLTTPADLI
jgi:hypothetical protein